jgi:hypothetical protein
VFLHRHGFLGSCVCGVCVCGAWGVGWLGHETRSSRREERTHDSFLHDSRVGDDDDDDRRGGSGELARERTDSQARRDTRCFGWICGSRRWNRGSPKAQSASTQSIGCPWMPLSVPSVPESMRRGDE